MTEKRPSKVLFVAEAVTLAHVARATTLARSLDPSRYQVVLAQDPRYNDLFGTADAERYDIESVSTRAFASALDRGAPLYDFATLERYVQADLRLIEAVDPDVVIGDFRLSLGVSARLAGKPYITVTNAGWSPYARSRFIIPDIALTRLLGPAVGQTAFDLVRPLVFAMHARPMNRLRRVHGMSPLPGGLQSVYTDADYVLYADLPELIPVHGAPSTHDYVGPVLWSPELPAPPWADDVPSDRPVVYATLGSSGKADVLDRILTGLAGGAYTVVAATANPQAVPACSPHAFVAPFLSGETWSARADVVICNGGSPSCYQALACGVPILGIPGNLDQYLNMSAVEKAGAGLLMRSGRAAARAIRVAVDQMIGSPDFRRHAQRLGGAITSSDRSRVLPDAIAKAMGVRPDPAAPARSHNP